ncbi:hypothetical protein GCM10007162_15590 [Ignatzschineria ureiclastica]|nr:IrmA family protein [Ignatzschineria ureiclastica]GHA00212.1 hypothetical protein GCM10007162_15590 [Ignatzschineria ureiclastica]
MKQLLKIATLTLLASSMSLAFGQTERSARIMPITSDYIGQGYCSYLFKVDNGGSGSEFKNLKLSLNAKDMFGQIIDQQKLEIEGFGDSNATSTTFGLLETECIDALHEFEIVDAQERQPDGRWLQLPLYLFSVDNPKLPRMTIKTAPGADLIHRNFIGTWVTDKSLCSNPEILDDSQYILTISGDTVRLNGWMFTYTESFPGLNAGDNEDFNTPEAFGGIAEFFQFAPDYSQTYGKRETSYHLNKGKLTINDGDLSFVSCQRR